MIAPYITPSASSRPRRVSGLLLVAVALTTGIFALLQPEVADGSRHRAGNGRVVSSAALTIGGSDLAACVLTEPKRNGGGASPSLHWSISAFSSNLPLVKNEP